VTAIEGVTQAAGEIAGSVEPATAAHLLLCLVEGMRVVGKTAPDRDASQALIDQIAR
jgi:TetR/AcrR family transcriptional repressor of nem operon